MTYQIGTENLVSAHKFGLMQGWSQPNVSRMKSQGRLVLERVGNRDLVNVQKSLERIAESADPQKAYLVDVLDRQRAKSIGVMAAKAQAKLGLAPSEVPPSDGAAETLAEEATPGPTYTQARTAREFYASELAKLDYEQKSGKLVDASAIRAEFGKQLAAIRDQMLLLPDRLAPRLVGLTEIAVVRATLMAEIRRALEDAAGERAPETGSTV